MREHEPAELLIEHLTAADPTEVTAAVRCLRGPARLGTRFQQIDGSAAVIDLELTRVVIYGHVVDDLEPGLTALVTLRGTGTGHLRTGDLDSGWQVIRETNRAH
ncbi:MAG TPA: hypothetical protein VFW65_05805 [Pseudonocardiaceae bacterium]|nr:hypothetical protein [Pseudonocardiaceae bacterium]